MGKIDDPSLQGYVGQLESLAQQNGITGKAAFYGFSGSPRFYFAAFEYQKGPNQSADDIFSDFARGYASAGKARIDMATKAVDASEEATIICARIRGGVRGSLCMWTDRDTRGPSVPGQVPVGPLGGPLCSRPPSRRPPPPPPRRSRAGRSTRPPPASAAASPRLWL